jgi:hypothetical protein
MEYINIFLLFTLLILIYNKKIFNYEKFNNNDKEIVIARFNENLEWLKEYPFNNYSVICYNSGNDNNFYQPKNMKIIHIKNIGKEAYTYLYHIINNYNNLANLTIFLPGSTNTKHKINTAIKLVEATEKFNKTIFMSTEYNDVKKDLYDFKLDKWCSTSKENILKNKDCDLPLSKIRPFGLWYKEIFGNIKTKYVNYYGLLSIQKKHIIQKPLEFYKKLLNEFKNPNDEVAHYFERSWEAIFYPMNDSIFIKQEL